MFTSFTSWLWEILLLAEGNLIAFGQWGLANESFAVKGFVAIMILIASLVLMSIFVRGVWEFLRILILMGLYVLVRIGRYLRPHKTVYPDLEETLVDSLYMVVAFIFITTFATMMIGYVPLWIMGA